MLHRMPSHKRASGPWASLGRYSHMLAYTPVVLCSSALGLALLRYMVVVFETFSIVRSERDQDYELLELCATGAGRSSPRMQATCMEATAARASPLLLAVFMRSASVFGNELYTLVAQPLQSVFGLSMLTVVGIAPWLAPLKTFLMTQLLRRGTTTDTDYRNDHVVVLTNGSLDDMQGGPLSHAAMRFRGIPRRMLCGSDQVEEGKERWNQSPHVDAEGFSEIEIAPASPERSNVFLRQMPYLFGHSKQD